MILVSHRLRGHGSLADCLLKQRSAVIEYLAHCGLRMYGSESEGVVSFWSWKVWFVTECDHVIFLYSTPLYRSIIFAIGIYYRLKSLQVILIGDSRIHNVIDFNNGTCLPLSLR